MKKNYISYLLIIIGGAVAIYANADEKQNTLVLVGGVVLLMLGIYRLARTIPSKGEREEHTSFVEEEE